ncbi:MAG: DUF6468 domain-containing protein [Alphaproteobacteria bacterium]
MLPHLTLIVEVIAAGLLLAVLVYAIRLNRLLAALKADRGELERLLQTFHQSTARAEQSVAKLRTSAADIAQALQSNVGKAEKLRDELVFIVDRAGADADRLEAAIASARHSRSAAAPAVETAAAAPAAQRVEPASGHAPAGRAFIRSTTRTVTPAQPAAPASAAQPEDGPDAPRRKTKSELLKALEGMR